MSDMPLPNKPEGWGKSHDYTFSVNVPAEIARRLSDPPQPKFTTIVVVPSQWIDAIEQTPAQWGVENHWGNGGGRHKVRLQDGREIFSWWKDGQWSVERLKPHLKVAFWKRPKIIA